MYSFDTVWFYNKIKNDKKLVFFAKKVFWGLLLWEKDGIIYTSKGVTLTKIKEVYHGQRQTLYRW